MKTTYRPVKVDITTSKALGIIHAQPFQVLIVERERSIYDSCRFDIGRFRAEPTNYERFLHPSHWHICISQCPQKLVSYATRNPHKLKINIAYKKPKNGT